MNAKKVNYPVVKILASYDLDIIYYKRSFVLSSIVS